MPAVVYAADGSIKATFAPTTIDLTTQVTGVLPVPNGGTGDSTLTAHSLLVGNGTNPVAFLAPGTSRNFPVSDGTDWVSRAMQQLDMPVMTGANGGDGERGAVPKPTSGQNRLGLFGDANWYGTHQLLLNGGELSGSQANIDINSIPTDHLTTLILVVSLRTDRSATLDDVYIRFNNDSTAGNYDTEGAVITGATFTGSAQEFVGATATGVRVYQGATATNAPANVFSFFELKIFWFWSTSLQKTCSWIGTRKAANTSGNLGIILGSGWWRSTNAITRITLLPVAGSNFVTGCAYELYGDTS